MILGIQKRNAINLLKTIKQMYKNKQIKRWPTCKSNIQKLSGCNHMTCLVWLHQFWWNWGQDYTAEHFGIFSTWALEGENRLDVLVMMLLLPLILFFVPFTIMFSLRKLAKEWMDFPYFDFISWWLAFSVAFILGWVMLGFYPFAMCFLLFLYARFHLKKWRYKY